MSPAVNIYSKLGPKINQDYLQSLENNRIVFDSKDIWLTFKAEGVRGKGIYITSLKRLSKGRLISTKSRFIAIAGGYKIIDISKKHKLFHSLTVDKNDSERYIIRIDLKTFQTALEGNITLAYHISPGLVII